MDQLTNWATDEEDMEPLFATYKSVVGNENNLNNTKLMGE